MNHLEVVETKRALSKLSRAKQLCVLSFALRKPVSCDLNEQEIARLIGPALRQDRSKSLSQLIMQAAAPKGA